MKRMLAGMMAILICSLSVENASASTISITGQSEIPINLSVQATTISATVALDAGLVIMPDKGYNSLISPSIKVTNTCSTPLSLKLVSFKAVGSAPAVVAFDKYAASEWKGFNAYQTTHNIAFRIYSYDSSPNAYHYSWWIDAQDKQDLLNLGNINAGIYRTLEFESYHGCAWPETTTFQYQMTLKIDVA